MIRTIKTKAFGDVPLYFGYRCLETIEQVMQITDLLELGSRFAGMAEGKDLNLKDITSFTAKMLWIGHENYCFMQQQRIEVDSWERMLFVIDEIKLKEAIQIATGGIKDILNIESEGVDQKKK
jgi:hypothetical protein